MSTQLVQPFLLIPLPSAAGRYALYFALVFIVLLSIDAWNGLWFDDPSSPGVFVKVRKPVPFVEANLDGYELHSMLKGRRCRSVNGLDILVYRITQGSAVLLVTVTDRLRRALSDVVPQAVKSLVKRTRHLDRPDL